MLVGVLYVFSDRPFPWDEAYSMTSVLHLVLPFSVYLTP